VVSRAGQLGAGRGAICGPCPQAPPFPCFAAPGPHARV